MHRDTDQIPWANGWMIHDVKIRDNDVSDISSKRCALKLTNPREPCYYTLNHTFLMFFFLGERQYQMVFVIGQMI